MRRIVHLAAFLAFFAAGAWIASRIPLLWAQSDIALVVAVLRRAAWGDTSMLASPWFLRPLACAFVETAVGVLTAFGATWLLGMGDNDTYGYALASGLGRTTKGTLRIGWVAIRVAAAIIVVLIGARYMLAAGTGLHLFG